MRGGAIVSRPFANIRCSECGDETGGPWGLWRDDDGSARLMCELCLMAHKVDQAVRACNCDMTLEEFQGLVEGHWQRDKEPKRSMFTNAEFDVAREFVELLQRRKKGI